MKKKTRAQSAVQSPCSLSALSSRLSGQPAAAISFITYLQYAATRRPPDPDLTAAMPSQPY